MIASNAEDIKVISFSKLPQTIKDVLEELRVGKQAVTSIKADDTDKHTVYAIAFYQDNKLKTMHFNENGQIENE